MTNIEDVCKESPVLFLDIDGVLSTPSSDMFVMRIDEHTTESELLERLEKLPCEALEAVISVTKCVLVITSSWRYTLPSERIEELLHRAGVVSARVISETEKSETYTVERDTEILKWVEKYKPLRFCALDDISLPKLRALGKFIQTPFTEAFSVKQVGCVVEKLLTL